MTQGDLTTGFEAAVRAHERELVSFAFRMTSREDEARDCVQDAFLKAHLALRNGAAPEQLRPWLYRLVYHAVVDRQRRQAIEERGSLRLAPTGDKTDGTFCRPGAASEELERLVGSLAAPYREILVLRYVYDFSYAEMESILAIPAPTLRVYAARALEQVQKNLQEDRHGM
jgi:RNA polymerase sigma-70 factor (ECF subfamily)